MGTLTCWNGAEELWQGAKLQTTPDTSLTTETTLSNINSIKKKELGWRSQSNLEWKCSQVKTEKHELEFHGQFTLLTIKEV